MKFYHIKLLLTLTLDVFGKDCYRRQTITASASWRVKQQSEPVVCSGWRCPAPSLPSSSSRSQQLGRGNPGDSASA